MAALAKDVRARRVEAQGEAGNGSALRVPLLAVLNQQIYMHLLLAKPGRESAPHLAVRVVNGGGR